MKRFSLLVFIILFAVIPNYSQVTIHIPADYSTIQAGINAATNGDIVLVEEGTYLENINYRGKAITVASRFLVDDSTSHISNTIIDGSQPTDPDSGSVVYFLSGEDTNSVLCGFTVTGGTGTPMFVGAPRLGRVGGGIFITDVGAKICHNYIINNSVTDSFAVIGGGLAAGSPTSNSFVIIEDNIFDSNSCLRSIAASEGGGMSISTKARIINNIFSNNIVSSDSGEAFGGGFVAFFNLDSVFIHNNFIINNKAESLYGTDPTDFALGGGLTIWNDMTANVKMYGNTIAFNEVSGSIWLEGAGCYFEDVDGEILFANNLVYNNFYTGNVNCHGTGIGIASNTRLSIINNTITGNEASPYGGALSTRNTISTVALNNIFWGNSSGPSMPEVDILVGSPPEIVYCDVQGGWTGTGNIDINPELMDTVLTSGDTLFAILSINSPCIDAGDPDSIYNDPEDPNNLGYALFPSRGTIRNDMGAYGGPGAIEWRIITDVNEDLQFTNEIPTTFQLLQNYPNPFNPVTSIQYAVNSRQYVSLKIHDILGNEVATLVNEEKPVGNYELTWNASNLPSGVYFYQIKAGSFIETKKMLLLK